MVYNNLALLLCRFERAKLQKNPFRVVVFQKNRPLSQLVKADIQRFGQVSMHYDQETSNMDWRNGTWKQYQR